MISNDLKMLLWELFQKPTVRLRVEYQKCILWTLGSILESWNHQANLLVVNHSSRADEEQKSRVFAEKEEEQNFFLLSVSMGMKKALWHCLTLTDWDVNS